MAASAFATISHGENQKSMFAISANSLLLRMNMTKLTIELVPRTCWFSNVRTEVAISEWKQIQYQVFSAANRKCEICGGVGSKHPVECHEVWEYDDDKKTQTLIRCIALCPKCHEVKHIGLASKRGRLTQAIRHLAKVNGWSMADAEVYTDHAFEIWSQRSNFDWKLDISCLSELYGVTPKPKKFQKFEPRW